MSVIYLLPCHCGENVEVTTAEAGRSIPCSCGKQVQVPTFREIQRLPRKQLATQQEADNWSIQQGALFSIGLVLLAVAVSWAGWLIYQRTQLDTQEIVIEQAYLDAWDEQIMALDAAATLDGWNKYLNKPLPEERPPPSFEVDRAAARVIYLQLGVAAVIAVIGLAMMGAGTMLKPTPTNQRKPAKRPNSKPA